MRTYFNKRFVTCTLLGVLCLTAIASPRISGASLGAESFPPVQTTVRLTLMRSHASVQVVVNGATLRFLLDTGADQNVITEAAARQLKLKPSKQRVPSSGASGSGGLVPWVTLKELRVGEARQRRQIAYVVPLPREFNYDGILGTPFFASFVTTLDYERRQLRLCSKELFVPPASAPVPLRREGNKLLVTATAAGITGWYTVDTGAGNALTLFTPTVEKNGLRTAFPPTIRMITGVSVGGVTRGDLVRLPEVVIGSHRLRQVVAELSLAQQGLFAHPTYKGNLGGELWRRFTVTFDYTGGVMYLEPNAAFTQPFMGPRTGLVPAYEQGVLKVTQVITPSPASEAGVVVGDVLVAVNGTPGAQLSVDALRELLQQAPGTQLKLRIRHAQATSEKDVVLVLRDLL